MLECWCSASHWHCPLHARYSRVNTTWHVVLNAFASSPVKGGSVGWRLWIWTSSWNGHWHGVWLATYTVMADYSDYLLAFWRTLNDYVYGTHHHRLSGSASPVLTATHHSYGSPRLSDFFPLTALGVIPLNGHSRKMAETTCFHARMCLLQ